MDTLNKKRSGGSGKVKSIGGVAAVLSGVEGLRAANDEGIVEAYLFYSRREYGINEIVVLIPSHPQARHFLRVCIRGADELHQLALVHPRLDGGQGDPCVPAHR